MSHIARVSYDGQHRLILPQATSTPLGFLIALFGLLIPFAIMNGGEIIQSSPLILQSAPTFKILENARLITQGKISETELLLFLYVGVQLSFAIFFLKVVIAQFSKNVTPPLVLKQEWFRSIQGLFLIGGIGFFGSLFWGVFAESTNNLTPKFLFCTLIILSLSTTFIVEGMLAVGLYAFFHFKFWKDCS